MGKIKLEQGENKIDTWTIMYIAPEGQRFNGKLTVTDKRLIYDAQFGMSMSDIIGQAFLFQTDSGPIISIPKDKIKKTEAEKKLLSKKIIITLDDDTKHTFSYGIMSIDKILDAIRVGSPS